MMRILASLNDMSWKKTLLFGVLLNLMYYFFVYDDGKGVRNQLTGIQREVKELEQKVEENKKVLSNQQAVKNEIGLLGEKFKKLLGVLPQQLKSSDMVARIQRASKASGTYMQSIQVDPVEEMDFYFIFPVSVTLNGSFSELADFIYKAGKTKHLIRVRKLKIFSFDSQPRRRKLRMEVQLSHYKYKPNSTPSKGL